MKAFGLKKLVETYEEWLAKQIGEAAEEHVSD